MKPDKAKLSPMMRHYMDVKEQYPDVILMYRLGDFYEMFFDDAVTVSRELELTLTGRDCGLEERAPSLSLRCRRAPEAGGVGLAAGRAVTVREAVEARFAR